MEDLQRLIEEWEYCYCPGCNRIRERSELKVVSGRICCDRCGGYNLESPAWVICPYQKLSAVKCPRGGRGIYRHAGGFDCTDRCYFRH